MNKVISLSEPKANKTNNNKSENSEITSLHSSRTTALEKEKHKRVITSTKKWRFTEDDYIHENQLYILKNINTNVNPNEKTQCIIQQINQKINGYKAQDNAKKMYDANCFVSKENVIELLIECELKCHYCKKDVNVLYELVREPKQWTLDRIDNSQGHNSGNLFISCLSCNLRRRTIYHEKYEMTKICTNVVKLD